MDAIFERKQDLGKVLFRFLRALDVKATEGTIRQVLEMHPSFPSLLAASDCLSGLNVKNQAFNIPRNDYDVDDLIFPFLAHLKEGGGRFIVIHGINSGAVSYSDERTVRGQVSENDFLDRWDGIALHAEKDESSGEVGYRQSQLKYFLKSLVPGFGLLLGCIGFYLAVNANAFLWPFLWLCLIKFVGVVVSVLLLIHSINSNNPFIQNLCNLGGKNGCNTILKSDAARVTSWLSWSEVGFFYFTGSLLSLLFAPSSLSILVWFNVLALPYTIYSVSYQYRNKNWCVLCCTVQALLMLEFTTALAFGLLNYRFYANSILVLSVTFLTPIFAWFFLKQVFLKAVQLKPVQEQLKQFKYNSNLFQQILMNQPRYEVFEELMPVRIGNQDAETVVTMVSNPFCIPCAKAHQTLSKWLQNRLDVSLVVLFQANGFDRGEKTEVARHLTAIGQSGDQNRSADALEFWYQGNRSYDELSKAFPIQVDSQVKTAIDKQRKWCEYAEIEFTPTILVNGFKLPQPYRLGDLEYFI